MAMMMGEDFQYVLRILNTNVDGRQKVMYAMCSTSVVVSLFNRYYIFRTCQLAPGCI